MCSAKRKVKAARESSDGAVTWLVSENISLTAEDVTGGLFLDKKLLIGLEGDALHEPNSDCCTDL